MSDDLDHKTIEQHVIEALGTKPTKVSRRVSLGYCQAVVITIHLEVGVTFMQLDDLAARLKPTTHVWLRSCDAGSQIAVFDPERGDWVIGDGERLELVFWNDRLPRESVAL